MYLDVDGVVVPAYDPAEGVSVALSGWRDWRGQSLTHGRAEPVVGLSAYSPLMCRRLRRLSEHEHVTFHWCTTWRDRADEQLAPAVGLPRGWEVIDADMRWDRHENETRTVRSWWKREAVQEHHAQRKDHAVVWIDDDLRFDEDAWKWVTGLGRQRALAISPQTAVGLTSRDMRRIEHFMLH